MVKLHTALVESLRRARVVSGKRQEVEAPVTVEDMVRRCWRIAAVPPVSQSSAQEALGATKESPVHGLKNVILGERGCELGAVR